MGTEHANVKTVAGIRYVIFDIWQIYLIYIIVAFPRVSGGWFLWQL